MSVVGVPNPVTAVTLSLVFAPTAPPVAEPEIFVVVAVPCALTYCILFVTFVSFSFGFAPFRTVSVLGVPSPVNAVTESPLALALVIPVATLITPVPAVAPVDKAIVGWVIVKVASEPITVSVCLLKVTLVTTSVKFN